MENSLIIIGSGVAGLAAGCYARMNGYSTTIFEMASTPGGLCTSWNRKGYSFDGSVAGLAGSSQGSPLYKLWDEIGVANFCPLHYGENFGFIHLPDGRIVTIYTNIDQLEVHLLEQFPHEKEVIANFIKALRSVLDLDMPFSDAKGWEAFKSQTEQFISTMAHLPTILKYGKMTVGQFVNQIKDPSLALVFNNIAHFGGPDVPLLTILLPLAYAHKKMAGIPIKGWLSFAQAIETRFIELGGKIQYQSKVSKIIIQDDVAKGIVLEDGTEYFADRVLSAADGRLTQSILLGKTLSDTSAGFQIEDISDQPVQVNIGVAKDFSDIKGPVTYILSESMDVAGRDQSKMTFHNKFYDQTAAPIGKSAITVFLDSDYLWWQNIALQEGRYEAEKKKCAAMVIEIMDQYYPGFSEKIEVVDVSTPLTRERYTGNFMGAMQARKPNAHMIKALIQLRPQYAYKGITGLYMAGQWVEAWGGITTAAQSGRKAIQKMCKDDNKPFVTTLSSTRGGL